jgi:hypothetical protein
MYFLPERLKPISARLPEAEPNSQLFRILAELRWKATLLAHHNDCSAMALEFKVT